METSSIIIKLKKIFLVMLFGMGVSLNVNVNADSIQANIRAKVHEHKNEIDSIKNSNQLNALLATLKTKILEILNSGEELSPRNQTLKDTLEKLNPSDKFSIATHIKTILACLDSDIANTIKSAIPQVYRTILGV